MMIKPIRLSRTILFIAILLLTLVACKDESYTPKPRAHFRIDMPEKKYVPLTVDFCPVTFQYPDYMVIHQKTTYFNENPEHPCWLNMQTPFFNSTLHLTYVEISSPKNLEESINDSYKYSLKHSSKADFIDEVQIQGNGNYGKIFDIGGNVASSVQFYITDSSKHFLRGSLYFHEHPNVDSLRPVINFLREDIKVLMNTTVWK
jgi:gliding motility-associated lipoprotein GldD